MDESVRYSVRKRRLTDLLSCRDIHHFPLVFQGQEDGVDGLRTQRVGGLADEGLGTVCVHERLG